MIDRGPGFLAVVWFGFTPTLSPPPLSRQQAASLVELTDGRGGGVGVEPNHTNRKKAWPSTNRSKLSDLNIGY
jgi:hypothetical protein